MPASRSELIHVFATVSSSIFYEAVLFASVATVANEYGRTRYRILCAFIKLFGDLHAELVNYIILCHINVM